MELRALPVCERRRHNRRQGDNIANIALGVTAQEVVRAPIKERRMKTTTLLASGTALLMATPVMAADIVIGVPNWRRLTQPRTSSRL